MEIKTIAQKLRTKKYAITRLQDESGVLLSEEDLMVFTLNDTGLFLLEAIEEGRATSEDDLIQMLSREFEVDKEQARQDIHDFLQDLVEAIAATPPGNAT